MLVTEWTHFVRSSIDILRVICQNDDMSQIPPLPSAADPVPSREEAILGAAFQAFSTYGFRRTTMEDIARGCGISRSALYLHFRNKEDIVRQLSRHYLAQAEQDIAAALARPGLTPAETLAAALAAKDGQFMQIVMTTPHGREMLEAGMTVAADIVAAGEARIMATFAAWFAGFDLAAGLGTPQDLARSLMTALRGLKHGSDSFEDYRDGQRRLAHLFGLGLSPRA